MVELHTHHCTIHRLHCKPRRSGPVPLSTVRGSVDDLWPELTVCVCPSQQDGPSVKLNTAAVLREGARVHQEQLQQEKR